MSDVATKLDIDRLVDELFSAIQTAQGYSFCSDGETFASVPDFFARIRGRLRWSEEATQVMRAFLKKYDQQPKVGRRLLNSPPIQRERRS